MGLGPKVILGLLGGGERDKRGKVGSSATSPASVSLLASKPASVQRECSGSNGHRPQYSPEASVSQEDGVRSLTDTDLGLVLPFPASSSLPARTCTGSAWETPHYQTGKKTLLILSLGFSYRPGGDCCRLILASWVSFETPQGSVWGVWPMQITC